LKDFDILRAIWWNLGIRIRLLIILKRTV